MAFAAGQGGIEEENQTDVRVAIVHEKSDTVLVERKGAKVSALPSKDKDGLSA